MERGSRSIKVNRVYSVNFNTILTKEAVTVYLSVTNKLLK